MAKPIKHGENRVYFATGKFAGSNGDAGTTVMKQINDDIADPKTDKGVRIRCMASNAVYDPNAASEIQMTVFVSFD